jgi:glycosyltransferase involved in cell wall biosynthesis
MPYITLANHSKIACKVLMLPKWYPSYLDKTEGNYVERHITAIAQQVSVVVLYVHSDANLQRGEYQLKESIENNYPVIRVFFKKHKRNLPILSNIIRFFRFTKAQWKGYTHVVKGFGKPHITHVHHLTRTTLLALFLKYVYQIPFLITEHWSGFLSERKAYKGWIKILLARWAVKKASCITCVSTAIKIGMQQMGLRGNFEVIPNVVNTTLYKPSGKRTATSKKKIVHISRLDTHVKNVAGILQATKLLANLRSDFELHFIGDGAEAEKQKQLALSLELPKEMVTFHGYKSEQEVAALLADAACLVIFSNYESQSCVMLEAFACGIPVIGTRVGGIPELLNPGRGILIDKQDVNGLCLAMESILNNTCQFDGKSIRDFAIAHFAQQVIGKSFSQIYDNIT